MNECWLSDAIAPSGSPSACPSPDAAAQSRHASRARESGWGKDASLIAGSSALASRITRSLGPAAPIRCDARFRCGEATPCASSTRASPDRIMCTQSGL